MGFENLFQVATLSESEAADRLRLVKALLGPNPSVNGEVAACMAAVMARATLYMKRERMVGKLRGGIDWLKLDITVSYERTHSVLFR